MNQTQKKLTYDDLDGLDLDLDVGTENDTVQNLVPNKVKQASENIFKKPILNESLTKSNKNNSLNVSKAPISKPLQEDNDLLGQLFNGDDDEEDDDCQEFFKNETSFMNTQKTNTSHKGIELEVIVLNTQSTLVANKSITQKQTPDLIISQSKTQTQRENLNSSKSRTLSNEVKETTKEVLNALKENKVWKKAQEELIDTFKNVKLDLQTIQDYNIQFYFKRFFEKDLIIRPDVNKNNIRKLPILCVCIKEISRKVNNATVILSDGSKDEISGTLSNSIVVSNWDHFMIGSVLILQDVCLIRVNYSKNCYHLNIKQENLLSIYYLNLEGTITDNEIITKQLIEIDCFKIKQLIDKFDELYTTYDYLSYIANTSVNKSKSDDQSIFKKKSNSLSNLHSKPAPYQIPNRPTQQQQQQKIQSNKPPAPLPPSNSNRNFQFKVVNTSNNTNSTVIDTSINTSINLSTTQSSQSGTSLTNEAFSQLIFGIEDEFLNDED